MYSIKIVATGANKLVDEKVTDLTITSDAKDELFEDVLGKTIYAVESAGYHINTHDIFTAVAEEVKAAKLNDKYKKVYTLVEDEVTLNISVKVN